jgi:hypothetical protein
MAKFNNSKARARNGLSPIGSTTTTVVNHNGGTGTARAAKSELFLAVVSDFAGEATFYEGADDRSARITKLVREIAVQDLEWLKGLAGWLRNEANMRSISLTVSLEGAKALNDAGIEGGRALVSSSIRRADEPGEALAYWFANFGRKMPSAVKRGIADAAAKTYSEYSLAKYDTASHGFRFGDVLELTHAKPSNDAQSALFKFALERRKNKVEPSEELPMLRKRAEILALDSDEKRKLILSSDATEELKAAGLTWEAVAGSFGAGGLDAKAWEALIPTMGYMALLRNLRNFEQAGVSDSVLNGVAARIADPEQVAKSRQLPFRFLSAFRANSDNLRWGFPLEQALNHSLANIPALNDTLILVDRSGSMFFAQSKNTDLNFADTAAVFGSALAIRGNGNTLVEFGSSSNEIKFTKTDSVLKTVEKFGNLGGTATYDALVNNFKNGKHKRVVVITDEQASAGTYHRLNGGDPRYWSGYTQVRGDLMDAIPKNIPAYTWNLAGYKAASGKSTPTRTYLGGLSDQAFAMIPLLEAGKDQAWPWE